jgi:hypothetical protein
MTDRPHITAARTAFGVLLVAALLTIAAVGTAGTAAAEPIDGKGNDVCPCEPLSIGSGTLSIAEVTDLGDRIGTLTVELPTDRFEDLDAVVLATPSPN